MISVIVVTYNQENTIARTLDSILKQKDVQDLEIIIGEDHSSDNTRQICETYALKYPSIIRLFSNSENKGIVRNYFDCLKECRGNYIADCAGDDFWIDEYKLKKERDIIHNHPEVSLVHTDWYFYDENRQAMTDSGKQEFDAPFTIGDKMLTSIITQTTRPIIHLCTSLYRNSAIKKAYNEDRNLFCNNDYGCEDLQIAFAMAQCGNIAYIPDKTLCYSIGHNSISSQPNDAKQFEFVKKTTNLSYYLSNKFRIKNRRTNIFFKQKLHALTMHAIRSNQYSLIQEVKHLTEEWHTTPALTTHILLLFSHNPQLFKIVSFLRKTAAYIKKHIF